MGKLLKFLKPYAGAVVAIICILVVQAYCDLSLPTYTSDIVNVGIDGVVSMRPYRIRFLKRSEPFVTSGSVG